MICATFRKPSESVESRARTLVSGLVPLTMPRRSSTPNSSPGSILATRDARAGETSRADELQLTPRERVHRERQRITRERWVHLLLLGFALSIIVHVGMMVQLWWIRAPERVEQGVPSMEVTLQSLPQAVNVSDMVELPDPSPRPAGPITAELDPLPNLSTDLANSNPNANDIGVIAAPGIGAIVGSGGPASGIGIGSGKGGGGTSFFGVGGRGSRFAFVVDVSGSMEQDNRLGTALAELKRSIGALPDYAQFYVVLFSNDAIRPDFEANGWLRATRTNIARMKTWIDTQPSRGGTYPYDALKICYTLPQPPDVIFFLTDGEIPVDSAELVRALAKDVKGDVVVNTIGFSSEAGKDQLIEIAQQNRGVFRFVPVRGGTPVTP